MINFGKDVFGDYENAALINYDSAEGLGWVPYEGLGSTPVRGVLKANLYRDGKLSQLYSGEENHTLVVAATRLGKTTGYVIPTILSNAKRGDRRSMIISDPKGELYRHTSAALREAGYKVLLMNFRDYNHSECWNMLTPIYRKYQKAYAVYDEVGVADTKDGPRSVFRGKVYKTRKALDRDLSTIVRMAVDDVGKDIDDLAAMFIATVNTRDPYWEDTARDVLKAFIWAMLEDSREESLNARDDGDFEKQLITEDTFSFNTVLSILAQFRDDRDSWYDDGGYFSKRPENSRARLLAKNSFIENAPNTRKCVISSFNAKLAVFRDVGVRLITGCNSFDMEDIVREPVAIFIDYRDEIKAHYQIISLFVQHAYKLLIERANRSPDGRLEVPFYFVLDEFGNFPAINEFDTTISACAGRNIFFILIIQSYAQLVNVYGKEVSEIILDNLNVKVFMGSNNYSTLEQFSRECGERTRISPLSALNGRGDDIDNYQLETIRLVTKSRLSCLGEGECIVTEANSGYVLFSKLTRYYRCPEFTALPAASEHDYVSSVNPFDEKYIFTLKKSRPRRGWDI